MQAEIVQPQIYFCRKCRRETEAISSKCPQCGKRMQTQSIIKSLGKVLVFLGRFIILGCGLVFLIVLGLLGFAPMSEKDKVLAFIALGWFGIGFILGIVAIFAGLSQAKHGRPNRIFMWIVIVLIPLMCILGQGFSFLKD